MILEKLENHKDEDNVGEGKREDEGDKEGDATPV